MITIKIPNHWGVQNARETHTPVSIFETFAEHAIGQELKAISEWLECPVEALDWVEKDIQWKGIKGYWASRHEHRSDIALRTTQATPAMDLRGTGISLD